MTEKNLFLAKAIANGIVKSNMCHIKRHFTRYVTRRYTCKATSVKFDERGALYRLRNAVLGPDDEDIYRHTDGKTILINSRFEMSFLDVVATLVHESLHDFCLVRGRKMGCEREHVCMRGLGERC